MTNIHNFNSMPCQISFLDDLNKPTVLCSSIVSPQSELPNFWTAEQFSIKRIPTLWHGVWGSSQSRIILFFPSQIQCSAFLYTTFRIHALYFFFSIYMLFYSLCFVYVMPNHIYLVNYYLSLNLRILYPWHSLLWLALSRADDAHYSIIESLCILIDDYHSIVVTAPCILFYQIVCQGNGFINSLTIGSIE